MTFSLVRNPDDCNGWKADGALLRTSTDIQTTRWKDILAFPVIHDRDKGGDMATASPVEFSDTDHTHALSSPRLLVAGGVTAATVFVLCWIGTFVPFSSPTHAYIALFTNAEMSSAQALGEGAMWSLLFGALVGALFALIYNATRPIGRRGTRP